MWSPKIRAKFSYGKKNVMLCCTYEFDLVLTLWEYAAASFIKSETHSVFQYLGILRFLTHVLVAALFGILCYDIGNDASKIATNIGCIFLLTLFLFAVNPGLTVLCCKYAVILKIT